MPSPAPVPEPTLRRSTFAPPQPLSQVPSRHPLLPLLGFLDILGSFLNKEFLGFLRHLCRLQGLRELPRNKKTKESSKSATSQKTIFMWGCVFCRIEGNLNVPHMKRLGPQVFVLGSSLISSYASSCCVFRVSSGYLILLSR